jgi:MFS family permease
MTYNVDNSVPYAQQNGVPPTENPGKTLGIVGLVLGIVGFFIAFLAPIAGLVVSIIGRNKSKRAGHKNGLAVAGIIVSIVALIANIITVIVFISVAATFGGAAVELLEQCEANPTGTVEYQGQQFNCEDLLQGTN